MTFLTAGASGAFRGHFSLINSATAGMYTLAGFCVLAAMTPASTTAASYVNLTLVGSANISFGVYSCTAAIVVA